MRRRGGASAGASCASLRSPRVRARERYGREERRDGAAQELRFVPAPPLFSAVRSARSPTGRCTDLKARDDPQAPRPRPRLWAPSLFSVRRGPGSAQSSPASVLPPRPIVL
jgi:hypothetical protein